MHSKRCSAYFEAESFIPDMSTIGEPGLALEGKVKKDNLRANSITYTRRRRRICRLQRDMRHRPRAGAADPEPS